jgi:hypothetical protein
MNIHTYEVEKERKKYLQQNKHKRHLSSSNMRLVTGPITDMLTSETNFSDTQPVLVHHSRRLRRSSNNKVGELVKQSFKKRSHDVIMHKVQGKCILQVIPPEMHLRTYLHVDAAGTYGLFLSRQYAPDEILAPSVRIASLRNARCFKKFDQTK